jgi:hypothetical protein
MAETLYPVTQLDANQVIEHAYDETNQALRTTAAVTFSGAIQVELDADDGDNVAISDGTNTLSVNPDGSINTSDSTSHALLTAIDTSLTTIHTNTDGIETVLDDILNKVPANNDGLVIGTENGQVGGTQHVFVNNIRQMILAAHDRDQEITYQDFGTKNQRITQIDYIAPSIGVGAGFTARKTLSYSLIGTRYRRDSITWSLI